VSGRIQANLELGLLDGEGMDNIERGPNTGEEEKKMKKADAARLAEHARNEQRARVGYPYEGRVNESAWVAEHLPRTRTEFRAVLDVVHARGWSATPEMLAQILLGGTAHIDSYGRWQIYGGNAELFAEWTSSCRKTSARHRCATCGAPAIGLANFGGWACGDHYDARS
jgi:hypothetical protein